MRYLWTPGEPVFDVTRRRHLVESPPPQAWDLAATFNETYATNRWGSPETRSGPGSERARMAGVVRTLPALLQRWSIRSILDAPCGDFNWMRDVNLRRAAYWGVDIVPDIVAANRRRFGPRFAVADITVHPLPRVDLIVCRDAMVHLTLGQAVATLANFRRSGSTFLLATTFPDTAENTDIAPGWWRPINLQLEPFSLPEPVDYIPDCDSDDFYSDKILALWRLADLDASRYRWP